jgi:predicted nuclease with TOPRIM domain
METLASRDEIKEVKEYYELKYNTLYEMIKSQNKKIEEVTSRVTSIEEELNEIEENTDKLKVNTNCLVDFYKGVKTTDRVIYYIHNNIEDDSTILSLEQMCKVLNIKGVIVYSTLKKIRDGVLPCKYQNVVSWASRKGKKFKNTYGV